MTVGGDTNVISAGAAALRKAAGAVDTMPAQVTSGGTQSAATSGQPSLAAAADRFAACWSNRIAAIATQIYAAAELADNAAKDLATAGGHPR